jgi:hypothetical protein
MASRHKTRPTEDQNVKKNGVQRSKDDREVRARTEVGKLAPKFDILEELAKKFRTLLAERHQETQPAPI